MQKFSSTPNEMISTIWRNRRTIYALVVRDIQGRYRGSALGIFWSFFNPLLILTVYTFVFSEVFDARWANISGTTTEFAVVLFAGLIIFNVFSECINRAPTLISNNSNYVKKVLFPLEILSFVVLLSSLYHALISLLVWLVAYVIFVGIPHLNILLFVFVIFPFMFLILGLSWALASMGVFLRDISQLTGIMVNLTMFLSPVFYPASAVPENYRFLLYLNPLTPFIEMTRDLLYWGKTPTFSLLLICYPSTMVLAWFGFVLFQKTRNEFADVI